MSFKVLSEDQHSFKVKHPDGSDFLIAKAGLDDKVMKKIKGFYQGGATGAGDDTTPDPLAQDDSESMAAKGWGQVGDMALAQNARATQQFKDAQAQLMAGNTKPMGDIASNLAMSTVRATPSGSLLGTLENSAGSNEQAYLDLTNQAEARGIPRNNAINEAVNLGASNPVNSSDSSNVVEKVKARFGDSISDAKWDKIQQQAVDSNSPYVPIIAKKGQAIGFFPNFDATPTGQIGDPAEFGKINNPKLFSNAEQLNWVDQKYGATKALLQKHQQAGIPANITTSSDLIAHDDYLNLIPKGSNVNIVLPHIIGDATEERTYAMAGMPSNQRLLTAYDKLKQSGVNASVSIPTTSGKLNKLDPFNIKILMRDYNAKYTPSED